MVLARTVDAGNKVRHVFSIEDCKSLCTLNLGLSNEGQTRPGQDMRYASIWTGSIVFLAQSETRYNRVFGNSEIAERSFAPCVCRGAITSGADVGKALLARKGRDVDFMDWKLLFCTGSELKCLDLAEP